MESFEQKTYLSQLRTLRELALLMLDKYSIKVKSLIFIHHGQNTTYKVISSSNEKFLLRICRKDYHAKESINEEIKWLNKLASNGINVPRPVKSIQGKYLETGLSEKIGTARNCVLLKWVEGRFVWNAISERHIYKLGQFMGCLQENGRKIKVSHRNYWDAEQLVGSRARFGDLDSLSYATKKQQEIIDIGRSSILKTLKKYERSNPDKQGLIHGDLHFGNFVMKSGEIGAFDFDDSGIGSYCYDLAVPISKFNKLPICNNNSGEFNALTEALLDGHRSISSWRSDDYKMVPDYLMARRIAVLGWMNERSSNPSFEKYLRSDIQKISKDIRKYC